MAGVSTPDYLKPSAYSYSAAPAGQPSLIAFSDPLHCRVMLNVSAACLKELCSPAADLLAELLTETLWEDAELLRFACDEYRQTIIMVTHDAAMADYADRILRIRDGAVSE